MNPHPQKDLHSLGLAAAASLPPATIDEIGWDILLALHSGRHGESSLEKLASFLSVRRDVMDHWLRWLEVRWLVAAKRDGISGEIRPVLTPHGREMVDSYLSAISALQSDHPGVSL